MKIFISYRRAEDNKSFIVGTIHKMIADAFGANEVFRDLNDIAGGAEWRKVLEHEINTCRVMLVIIGPEWANLTNSDGQKRLEDPNDVTRWEVETGLKRSADGSATVIPVLVTGAGVPNAGDLPPILRPLLDKNVVQIRNYPDFERDMKELIRDIETSQGFTRDGKPRNDFEPEMVYIAEGKFVMGSAPGPGIPPFEYPSTEVDLPAYRIGLTPVTNALFEAYLNKKEIPPPPILGWDGQSVPEEMRELPVAGVTWFEARDYCLWLSEATGHEYSLPNEAQWEKACRGGNTSLYPWGNEYDPKRSNHNGDTLAAVKAFPPQNDFGLYDLVGNIRQWTRTVWGRMRPAPDKLYEYPWSDDKRRNELSADSGMWRVVRGCSYRDHPGMLRSAARERQLPGERGFPERRYGFRVVRND